MRTKVVNSKNAIIFDGEVTYMHALPRFHSCLVVHDLGEATTRTGEG